MSSDKYKPPLCNPQTRHDTANTANTVDTIDTAAQGRSALSTAANTTAPPAPQISSAASFSIASSYGASTLVRRNTRWMEDDPEPGDSRSGGGGFSRSFNNRDGSRYERERGLNNRYGDGGSGGGGGGVYSRYSGGRSFDYSSDRPGRYSGRSGGRGSSSYNNDRGLRDDAEIYKKIAEAQMSENEVSTTEPKWKSHTALGMIFSSRRRSDGHLQHVEILSNPARAERIETLLLGDSMLEQWKTTPKIPVYFDDSVFNAGVSGDRIENILWRIVPNQNISDPTKSNDRGLLSLLPNIKQVIFFVGTNNMGTHPPSSGESFEKGIQLLLFHIINNCKSLTRVFVMALPSHSKASHYERSLQYNLILKSICSNESTNPNGVLQYCDELLEFTDDYYERDYVHFNRKGYEKWYPLLTSKYKIVDSVNSADISQKSDIEIDKAGEFTNGKFHDTNLNSIESGDSLLSRGDSNQSVAYFSMETKTALAFLVNDSKALEQIDSIRAIYDKSFKRWMPHVNFIFPFIHPSQFETIRNRILKLNIQPFDLIFDKVGYFLQQKGRVCTLHLRCDAESERKMVDIFNAIVKICPEIKLNRPNFIPHLTLGQCEIANLQATMNQFTEALNDSINHKFYFNEIHFLHRTPDTNDRMVSVDSVVLLSK